jgi:TorA maturation chaperone TorD
MEDIMIQTQPDITKQRSNIYGLLSLVFRTEVTSDLLRQIKEPAFLSTFASIGAGFEDDFVNADEEQLLEDLAVEYARLFLGPDKHISPHESVHHDRDGGDWGQLWGLSTVEVKKFIESAGLEYKSEFTGLPDHISVELEFMQELTKEEALERKNGDHEKVNYCLQIEKKFIDDHLVKWIPLFCDKVIDQATLPFYRELAKVTKDFIEFEGKEIAKYAEEAQKEV